MHWNRLALFSALSLFLLLPAGCRGKRRTSEPWPESEPEVVYEEAAPVGLASEPCDSAERAHHWIYYPDEPLYFCDRHRHHWVPDGVGGWAHIHEFDRGRPNYSAPILVGEDAFEIYLDHDAHAAQYPPGSRR